MEFINNILIILSIIMIIINALSILGSFASALVLIKLYDTRSVINKLVKTIVVLLLSMAVNITIFILLTHSEML